MKINVQKTIRYHHPGWNSVIHIHCCVIDGVFRSEGEAVRFDERRRDRITTRTTLG
jgi:hypothetical protein